MIPPWIVDIPVAPRAGAWIETGAVTEKGSKVGGRALRGGNLLPVLICIAAPFLLLHRKRWVLIALQAFAYFAAAIWIYTAIDLVNKRLLAGEPFRGVIIILGSVTLFTAAAGLLMNLRGMKDRFPTEP